MPIDFDHVSYAVTDAMAAGQSLRRRWGAIPIAGEAMPEFRYLLMYVGDDEAGSRIEFLEPDGDGFVRRFLDRFGSGPHHVTFDVPDLERAVTAARALGLNVDGEDYAHASWEEAFIAPHPATGCVVQLARSDRRYPPAAELVSTQQRDVESFPSSPEATDPRWWEGIWETSGVPDPAQLTRLHWHTTDPALLTALLRDVLDGVPDESDALRWPSMTITPTAADRSGIGSVSVMRNGTRSDVDPLAVMEG